MNRAAGHGRILCKRAERNILVIEDVRDHEADFVAAEIELERRIGDGVVGEAGGDVFLVAAKNCRPT